MTRKKFARMSLAVLGSVLIALSATRIRSILPQVVDPPIQPEVELVALTGLADVGWPPMYGEELIKHATNVDFLELDITRYQPGADVNSAVLDSIRIHRPNIKIGAYLSAFFVYGWQKKAAEMGSLDPTSFSGEWWYKLSPFIARTDSLDPGTGLPDSAATWLNDYVIDISNPECRRIMIDIYNRHRGSTDWVMLDFCSIPIPDFKIWQGIAYQNQEHGDLDLDQNGIPQKNDINEQGIQKQAFYSLIRELRVALPTNMLIIANGTMALQDTVFAKLLDGIVIESWTQMLTGWKPINYLDYQGALSITNPIGIPVLTKSGRYYSLPGYVLCENLWDQDDRKYLKSFPGAVSVKRTSSNFKVTSLFVY